MKLRVARHTTHLKPIINFYTQILGLEVLGSFQDHDDYDGVFLGLQDENWHLEFTVSNDPPNHHPDEDDLLVFYPKTHEAFDQIVTQFSKTGIKPLFSKNPYWNLHGFTFPDPDGFRVTIVNPH